MNLKTLKKYLESARQITVITGAGISVPSGIPDFRSSSGLYKSQNKNSVSPEEVLSRSYFFANTVDFYDFYRNKMIYRNALPNVAHYTIAKLETMGKVQGVITQNIDGLHQAAGSKNVVELHGSINRNYCLKCGQFFNLDAVLDKDSVPYCECGGLIKPDVVLYEEPLNEQAINNALFILSESDMLIVAGTSLLVNPAASLINYFRGKYFVIINLSNTPYDNYADLLIRAPLENVLTDDLLSE